MQYLLGEKTLQGGFLWAELSIIFKIIVQKYLMQVAKILAPLACYPMQHMIMIMIIPFMA